jgi:hypothetical protein
MSFAFLGEFAGAFSVTSRKGFDLLNGGISDLVGVGTLALLLYGRCRCVACCNGVSLDAKDLQPRGFPQSTTFLFLFRLLFLIINIVGHLMILLCKTASHFSCQAFCIFNHIAAFQVLKRVKSQPFPPPYLPIALPVMYIDFEDPVTGNFCCVIFDPTADNAAFESWVMLGKMLGFLLKLAMSLVQIQPHTLHSQYYPRWFSQLGLSVSP